MKKLSGKVQVLKSLTLNYWINRWSDLESSYFFLSLNVALQNLCQLTCTAASSAISSIHLSQTPKQTGAILGPTQLSEKVADVSR